MESDIYMTMQQRYCTENCDVEESVHDLTVHIIMINWSGSRQLFEISKRYRYSYGFDIFLNV